MGILSAILGWLQYHLGIRTDAASESGSLHGKVANVRGAITNQTTDLKNTLQKPRSAKYAGDFSTSETSSYQTALSVTGRGRLVNVWFSCNNSTSINKDNMKIIIDGTAIYSNVSLETQVIGYYGLCSPSITNDAFIKNASGLVDLNFKTSLEIQVLHRSGPSLTAYWIYELE